MDEILLKTTFQEIVASPDIPSSSNKVTDASKYEDMPTVEDWTDFIPGATNFKRSSRDRYEVNFKIEGERTASCEKRVETLVTVLLDKLRTIYKQVINPGLSHEQTVKSDLAIKSKLQQI